MMSYESFLKYKVDTKISALSNLEIAVIFWLITVLYISYVSNLK
jgi:hypothetical protein